MRLEKLVIGSLLACALAFSGAAGLKGTGGQVWHVPSDFSTIQAAVDAATEGDTILVAPGIYTENVVVSKSRLTLRGAGPVSPVERPTASDGDNVVLDGTALGGLGIGIYVLGASAAEPVTGVQVSQFEVRNFERGITVQWAVQAQVSHNYLHGNLDKVAPAVLGDGFGIELTSAVTSDVSHNVIAANGLGGVRVGGIPGSTRNTVHHNRIVDNGSQSPSTGRNGAGVLLTGPSNQRAGIAIMGSATGNTIVHNDARDNNLSGLAPCRRCNLFDNSIGRDGGNIWDKNLGIFGIPGDPCQIPLP
jgi:hypothetical protein